MTAQVCPGLAFGFKFSKSITDKSRKHAGKTRVYLRKNRSLISLGWHSFSLKRDKQL